MNSYRDLLQQASNYFLQASDEKEWVEEFKNSNYSKLSTILDEKIDAEPNNPTYRLWWVQLNLASGGLPIMALNAPLEEIYQTLAEQNNLAKQSYAIFLSVGAKLAEKNQLRLAIIMLERAEEFLKKSDDLLNTKEHKALRDFLNESISEEIKLAEKRRENKTYISSLEEKLKNLPEVKVKEVAPAKVVEEEAAISPSRDITAKSIIEKSHEEEAAADEEEELETESEEEIRASNGGLAAFGIISVALLLLAYSGKNWLWPIDYQPKTVAKSDATEKQTETKEFEKIDLKESEDNELAAVTERLKVLETRRKENETAEKIELSKQVEPTPPAPEPKPAKSVIEPERSVPDAKPIRANLKQEQITPSGSAHVYKGKDGRTYGPPPGSRAKDREGRKIKGYPVKQYTEPEIYETITATDVFTAPSLMAKAVVRLESGAKVQVISRMGHWLELRSTGGTRGYIYAQDAVKVSN